MSAVPAVRFSDGFVARPNQSVDDPIGEGGMRLHEWVFRTASWRAQQGLAAP